MISEEDAQSISFIFFYLVDLLGMHFAFLIFFLMLCVLSIVITSQYQGFLSWKNILKPVLIVMPIAIPFYLFMMIAHYDDKYKFPIKYTSMEENWLVGMIVLFSIGLFFIFAIIKYFVKDRKNNYNEYFMKKDDKNDS
jgi:uncharacterized membrane protein